MECYDVAVIGAGPVGSNVAWYTAKNGLRTLLVEEHKSVGKPLHCAGLLYHKAIDEFDISKDAILNKLNGAYLHSPSGIILSLHKANVDSYVVDREVMDLKLAVKACDNGTSLLLNTKCYHLEKNTDGWLLKLKKENSRLECKARITVDAEGWCSQLTERMGIKKSLEYLKGAQFEMSNVNFQSVNHVEIYFGEKYFPGFFAWIIPISKEKAKVGLCVNKKFVGSPFFYLEKALKKHPLLSKKISKAKVEKKYGGIIPIHGPIKKTYLKNFLIVGDAAGQVKSTTGGGIYFGLKASLLAGETAVRFMESSKKQDYNFEIYERLWKQSFGREIDITSKVRRIADKFSDKDLDTLFNTILENEEIIRNIEMYGDTGFQSDLFTLLTSKFKRVLFKPRMLKILAKNISEILKLARKI